MSLAKAHWKSTYYGAVSELSPVHLLFVHFKSNIVPPLKDKIDFKAFIQLMSNHFTSIKLPSLQIIHYQRHKLRVSIISKRQEWILDTLHILILCLSLIDSFGYFFYHFWQKILQNAILYDFLIKNAAKYDFMRFFSQSYPQNTIL